MQHYTCDLCGRSIEGQRFSVSIEIQRHDPPTASLLPDPDHDFLHQLEDELLGLTSTSEFHLPEPSIKTMSRDLCPTCARRYERDPLSREAARRLNNSAN